jgi:hypothetical protein
MRVVFVNQHNHQESIDNVNVLEEKKTKDGFTALTLQFDGYKPYSAIFKQVKVIK